MNMHFIDRRVLLIAGICTLMKGSLSQLASPVIVSEKDTARFRWQIPAGESFVVIYVKNPSNDPVLSANAANQSTVSGDYTTRVTYKGALSVRTMAFDLSDVQTTDSGTYKCGLNSLNIIADCGQKLIVLGQPTKPVLKVPSTPVVGRQVTLTCSSTSTTVPSDHGLTLTYTWQRDNTDITVTSPGSPYIFTVNSRDSHSYRCRARESQGPESPWSDVYKMMPEYAPYGISLQPPSLFYNKTEGQESVPAITCTARCRPDCSYKWYKNGKFYRNGATLNLGQADRTQSGSYQCRATNTHSTTPGDNVSVNIAYAPTINILSNKNVTENTSPNIDCSSNITPGKPLSTNYGWTGPDGYSKTGAVLDRNVTRSQGGQYTCTATNTAGLSDTGQVNINVQYAPVITSVPSNKDVTENTSPNIDCSSNITQGNPSSTSYMWTGPVGYSKIGSVLDRNVTRTQGGQYTCTATNTAGLPDTAMVSVNVQYLDFPTLTISSAQVVENSTVQVVCNVASNPKVQMTIRNVDNNTNLVEQEVTNRRQYDIESVQCLHNGTYQCVADNRQISRTENASASLNVLCSPRHDFRKNFTHIVASEINETAIMVADVIANPLPNFTWVRYDGNRLVPISNSTIHSVTSKDLQSVLQINVSDSRDYGEYAVQVKNVEDKTLLVFELTAKSPPFPPTKFGVKVAGAKSATLQWTSNFNGGAGQTFYLEYRSAMSQWKNYSSDGIKDPGRDNVVTVNITQGLEPNTKYDLKLYSHNIYGRSDTETTTITTVKEQVIPVSPVNIAAIAGGIGAALLVIIIVSIVILLYKRGVCGAKEKKTKDVALFERGHADEEKPEMCDNVLYATSAKTSREKAVMEDNVLYAGSGDVNGGASAAAASGGDVYAVVQKKKPVTDVYSEVKPKKGKGADAAKPEKKKGFRNAAEKKKNKKKGKKADDQKPLKNKRSRGDVYENTVPGQFQEGNTYANAGFEGDEDTNKEQAPAYGRDEDGLLYVGIDFSNQKPSQEVHGAEDSTEYAGIAFGKVGPPLPLDKDEKKE